MSKKWSLFVIVIIIIVLAGYIISDAALKRNKVTPVATVTKTDQSADPDKWSVVKTFEPGSGQLKAIAVTLTGNIILGGESFLSVYDPEFRKLWEIKTENPVTAVASSGENIYAALTDHILALNLKGERTDEWGPFESNANITSVSSNDKYVAFADATNKLVYILDKKGAMKYLIGKGDEPFIVPSLYFDLALAEDKIYIVNPGKFRIESRTPEGALLSSFGEPGVEPEKFAGCCNPADFCIIPRGFVTAEKGINRIKILDKDGVFKEFVSSVNNFVAPVPLDVASADGKIIYGANPADSKVYVFMRK